MIRHTLDRILVRIPSDCPFHRTVFFIGKSFTIPPLCKLNPFYEQIMAAKFRAMERLAQEDNCYGH